MHEEFNHHLANRPNVLDRTPSFEMLKNSVALVQRSSSFFKNKTNIGTTSSLLDRPGSQVMPLYQPRNRLLFLDQWMKLL